MSPLTSRSTTARDSAIRSIARGPSDTGAPRAIVDDVANDQWRVVDDDAADGGSQHRETMRGSMFAVKRLAAVSAGSDALPS